MVMRTRQAGALSQVLLATVAAAVLAAVAACGSVAAGPASHPAPAAGASTPAVGAGTPSAAVPLCADASHLDRVVVVVLSPGLLRSQFREALPAGITITDPAQVRAVAAALCALPVLAGTHMQCMDTHGDGYRLTFAAAGRAFPPVLVELGCRRSVSGLGPPRMVSVALWNLLRKDLGTPAGTPAAVAP
ncbi:MAG TPA: hypothetical protein VLW44_13660 [Streptosporangiaceae bacterium]|nr:hypothetical protein [Streptosporangiaceae bacterium]